MRQRTAGSRDILIGIIITQSYLCYSYHYYRIESSRIVVVITRAKIYRSRGCLLVELFGLGVRAELEKLGFCRTVKVRVVRVVFFVEIITQENGLGFA